MSRRQLTSKQHSFLEYLKTHVGEHKVWPTYREIVDHFDYRSPNSVTQNLQALTKKGFLRRDHNGYHLVDDQREDGTIRVRGVLRGERLDGNDTAERFSLHTLFPGLKGFHALRLDGVADLPPALKATEYLLLAEGDQPPGTAVAVLHDGALSIRHVTASGSLEDPAGDAPTLAPSEARVLGRYVGHAGRYGIVRGEGVPSATQVSAAAMAAASFT